MGFFVEYQDPPPPGTIQLRDIAMSIEIGGVACVDMFIESEVEEGGRLDAIRSRCFEAERRPLRLVANNERPAPGPRAPQVDLKVIPPESVARRPAGDELLDEFDAYLLGELGRSPKTVRSYRFCFARIERFAGRSVDELITEPAAKTLRAFKGWAAERYSPGTIAMSLAAVHVLHDFGVVEGYWTPQPAASVKAPMVRQQVKPSLRTEDAVRFLEAAEKPNELRVVWLGLYVATRVSEASRMNLSNIDGDRLRFVSSKTGTLRETPIHPALAPRLEEILSTRIPKSPRALEYAVDELKERTGVKTVGAIAVSSHVFRRTFSTQLLEADVPLWMVELLMGHQSSSMTLSAYAAVPFRRKVEALRRLDYSKLG